VLVQATYHVATAIILEASLSFLGLGVQPPTPTWGVMIASGRSHLPDAWWISTFAGLAIMTTVLAFNLLGDGLRDALDPKLKR
jgi:ABC-type dipeptide/oligopeptide/nickel transport system permease subunit